MNVIDFLDALLRTDSPIVVSELLSEYVRKDPACVWEPVGGRRNNSGIIQVAGDPARALIERVTNGIDAVIERAKVDHGDARLPGSPRDAVQKWFGVPRQGLHKLTAGERRKLAQDGVTLTLFPGLGRGQRTVDVADKGIGVSAEQMANTILSLNAENKLDKFYLAGAFGQGGSATFASSEYTLIASRKPETNEVAFTVVRLNPPLGTKLGSYVFLTSRGIVLKCKAPASLEEFSTRIRHYGYDLDDYPSPVGPTSLYGRAQAVLFDPVLPFWFENKVHKYSRTIKGSRTALNGASEDDEEASAISHSIGLFFADLGEFGQLGLEYWVLEASSKSAPNKAFVNGGKPIVLSINGQTHAEWSALLLRKDAELPHLASRMVVHLDCNRLSFDAKRVLFVSNREDSRKGVVRNLLVQELLSALKSDDRLTELEEEARLAGARKKDEEAEREIRKEVAKMLRMFGFAAADATGGKPKTEGGDATNGSRKTRVPPTPRPATRAADIH